MTPALPSLRRLALSDLTADALGALIREGEHHVVERKREPPAPPKFGAAVASFANTLGGWVLLGVADDGSVVGWEPPGRADAQAHLGQVLRAEVDPLPPFAAAVREHEGQRLTVLRVFESADVPHIVRGTGALYVRTSAGKEPVDSHATLLEMAQRGRVAEDTARRRLHELAAVRRALSADQEPPRDTFRFIFRAAPLTLAPAFSGWALSERAAAACLRIGEALLGPMEMPLGGDRVAIDPFSRGFISWGSRRTPAATRSATFMVDAGGVVGARLEVTRNRGNDPPTSLSDPPEFVLGPMLDDVIGPLIRAVVAVLVEAEAVGRIAVEFRVGLPMLGRLVGGTRVLARPQAVDRELVCPPTDDEVVELAGSVFRELERAAGLLRYEEPQTDRYLKG